MHGTHRRTWHCRTFLLYRLIFFIYYKPDSLYNSEGTHPSGQTGVFCFRCRAVESPVFFYDVIVQQKISASYLVIERNVSAIFAATSMEVRGWLTKSMTRMTYYLKDHLGSIRMVVSYNGSTPTVEQVSEYYPFGALFAENSLDKNSYLYNGKELQNEFFENYDAELGRFHTIDPLTEMYSSQSPFVYADNNPVRFIDFMGMGTEGYTIDEEGNIERVDDTGGDEYGAFIFI